MKIIHMSDLHLESRMESHLSPQMAQLRKSELLLTFANTVDYAIQNQISIIIIAGDMFDGTRITAKATDFVLDKIKNAPCSI